METLIPNKAGQIPHRVFSIQDGTEPKPHPAMANRRVYSMYFVAPICASSREVIELRYLLTTELY